MPKLETHPVANIFPMMCHDQYEALKRDIAENGVEQFGLLYEGKILDGRNRYKACCELGMQLEFMTVDTSDGPFDPLQYVLTHNLHRRHLHTSQRAMIAAKMATLKHGVNQHCKEELSNDNSIQAASDLLNVGKASVCRAKHVIEHGCKLLIEAVENREISVSLAYKLCNACEDKKEQAKLVKQGKAAIKEHLDEAAEPKAAASPSTPAESSELVQVFRKTANRIAAIKQLIAELEPHEACVVIDSIGDWCEAYANAE